MKTHRNPHTLRPLYAAAALCAATALSSPAALAQDAVPVIDLPAASAPVPTPTIVLPAVSPAPAQSVEVTPVAATPAEPAVRSERRSRPAAAPERIERTPVAESAKIPTTPVPAAEPAAPVVVQLPAAEPELPPARPVVSVPVEADRTNGGETAILSLLGAIGLAGAALLLARWRRRREYVEEATDDSPEYVFESRATVLESEPEAIAPPVPLAVAAPVQSSVQATASGYTIPDGPIPRGPARDAILERMIAGAPDETNPFTSRKARLRRARLILQKLEIERNRDESQFDWRTYRSSARDPAPATPPRVTV